MLLPAEKYLGCCRARMTQISSMPCNVLLSDDDLTHENESEFRRFNQFGHNWVDNLLHATSPATSLQDTWKYQPDTIPSLGFISPTYLLLFSPCGLGLDWLEVLVQLPILWVTEQPVLQKKRTTHCPAVKPIPVYAFSRGGGVWNWCCLLRAPMEGPH